MKNRIAKVSYHVFIMAYFGFFFNMHFTLPVYAYVDPATTAMLTQIIAGIFISLGVVFGVFRRKIILFFKNLSVRHTKRRIEKQNRKTH